MPWRYLADVQQENKGLLQEIGKLRNFVPISSTAKAFIPVFAQQSCAIEHNTLVLEDSLLITKALQEQLFGLINLASVESSQLKTLDLPSPSELLSNKDPNQVAELRNHIVASQWIAETASSRHNSTGLGESDIQSLAALVVKDTPSEALYYAGWGGRSSPGDYRKTPIRVRSNHLRVFPYHVEVPALMKQFILWRDDVHNKKLLHPLILACHTYMYFVHIHPFIDGNGRVGRMLMQDYMLRQGYIPIVYEKLDRERHIQMVSDAQDGIPGPLIREMLSIQLDTMSKLQDAKPGFLGTHYTTG